MNNVEPADLDGATPPVAAPTSNTAAAEFADFYRAEFDGQLRRAALFLGSEAAGADAVHDAFVALFRRWDQIREPGPYLNRTVLNRCRDVARRDQRAKAAIQRSVVRGDTDEHDPLWDVLVGLPFNHRAAVVLRYYARMSEAEIATAIGCPAGSVGPWISRALAAMRKELQ